MTLTPEQIKIAKKACKENGVDPKSVEKQLGNGFWADTCKSSFEGYIAFLIGHKANTESWIKMMNQSHANIMNGRAGASHFD